MNFEAFLKYHKVVLCIIDEITDLLDPQKYNPIILHSLISAFAVLNKNYFEVLIPEFIKSPNPGIRDLAKKDIIDELLRAYNRYFLPWCNYLEIENNPQKFRIEIREYLAISKAKIATEMQIIYPTSK